MNRNTLIFVITMSVLLGFSGTGWSSDWKKGLEAYISGDYATAVREWTPLAKQGNAVAQNNLGWMYANGLAVPQDYQAAVKWYSLAAEQGVRDDQKNLAAKYYTGQGIQKDNVYAYMWWDIAASKGQEKAGKERDTLAKEMTPSQIEEAQKLARECVAKNYKGC